MRPCGETSWHVVLAVLSATLCTLWTPADGVAPRRSRSRARSSLLEKSRRAQLDLYLHGLGHDMGHKALQRPLTTPTPLPPARRHFRASVARCCKIGDKTARKRLSCSLDEHAVSRKRNLVHQAKLDIHTSKAGKTYTDILVQRIAKCSVSKFAGNFEKCCSYRQQFLKEMETCRTYQGLLRRKCRRDTRKRFP